MNINPGKTEFSEAEHASLRAEIRAILATGVTQAHIGREADVPSATLSQYLSDSYPNEKGKAETANKLTRWLRAREQARAHRRRLPEAPSYLPLQGSQDIREALMLARATGRMVLVTGSPGTGKTSTCQQFREDFPRTWYAAMDPTTRGAPTMLLEVLQAMGAGEVKGTPQALLRKVLALAIAAPGLILIDEAQHLSEQALETLRAISDRSRDLKAGVGIALLGNEEAYSRVGPTGVKPAFAQVASRFAHREYIARPNPDDAARLATAWADVNGEVIGPQEIAFCQQIAAKPGGLRNVEMTMSGAILAARGADEPLALDHLQGAFDQLSGQARSR
jgi:DNA transposition AAA+ family ATPase